MGYDFQFELFKDVYDFNKKINSRKNNDVMANEHSSQKHDDWSGTSTYEEAETLLTKGWSAKVGEMKAEIRNYSRTVERTKMKYKASMAGFAPIIPAAVKGVPKSMWMTQSKKKLTKEKCLHIYFNNNGVADVGSDELMQSGMAVLKLCVFLEKMGIRVKIDILPFVAKAGDSVYGCGFCLKDYKQPFNLQKMAYPIAHTAMFRRQGFKWLETMEQCTNDRFAIGYGSTLDGNMKQPYLDKFKLNEEGSVYIGYYDCQKCGFDPERIARKIGVLKEEKK